MVAPLALLGGLLGAFGAIMEEWSSSMSSLALSSLIMVVVAPAIEEIMKPIGVVFLLDKKPEWFSSGAQVTVLAVSGAFIFSAFENLIYIGPAILAAPEFPLFFVAYRLIVCTAMHLGASFVFGLGLAKMYQTIMQSGGAFDIDVIMKYYVAAVVIHGAYNLLVLILSGAGLLRF